MLGRYLGASHRADGMERIAGNGIAAEEACLWECQPRDVKPSLDEDVSISTSREDS